MRFLNWLARRPRKGRAQPIARPLEQEATAAPANLIRLPVTDTDRFDIFMHYIRGNEPAAIAAATGFRESAVRAVIRSTCRNIIRRIG